MAGRRSTLEERVLTVHLPAAEWAAIEQDRASHKDAISAVLTAVAETLHQHSSISPQQFKMALRWHNEPNPSDEPRQVRVALAPFHWILLQACADALESQLSQSASNFLRVRLRIARDQQRPTRREIAERVIRIIKMPIEGEDYERAVAELEHDTGMSWASLADIDSQRDEQEMWDAGAIYDLLIGENPDRE